MPVFRSSVSTSLLVGRLVGIGVLIQRVSAPGNPSLGVVVGSEDTMLTRVPDGFAVDTGMSLSRQDGLTCSVAAPYRVGTYDLAYLGIGGVLAAIGSLAVGAFGPARRVVTLYRFRGVVASGEIVVPAFLESVGMGTGSLSSLRGVTAARFGGTVAGTGVVPCTKLMLIVAMASGGKTFGCVGPRDRFVMSLNTCLRGRDVCCMAAG